MAINTQKVLLGGIAAGVVLNAIDYVVYDHVFVAQLTAATDAFKPGLSAAMMQGSSIAMYIITDFVLGMLLVWTYAAIRPRFGPGAKTAVTAAILFWLLGCLYSAPSLMIGMQPMSLWWTLAIVSLVNFLIASWVGAWLYTEDGTATAA
jgi:hypothetical protein